MAASLVLDAFQLLKIRKARDGSARTIPICPGASLVPALSFAIRGRNGRPLWAFIVTNNTRHRLFSIGAVAEASADWV